MTTKYIKKLFSFIKTENLVFFVLLSIFLIFLFSFKDILILLNSKWRHLYPVSNISSLTFEEVNAYLPLMSRNNMAEFIAKLPISIPFIASIVQWIFLKWLCFSNLDIYLFISHTLLPLTSFWVMYLVYRKYVSAAWSVLLSFLGITFYHSYSSFGYFINVMFKHADILKSASLAPLEITRTPFPSFSFFVFILTFYLCIRNYKFDTKKYILLSFLWALNFYVYPFNFIAGSLFWLPYIVFVEYMKGRELNLRSAVKTVALCAVVISAALLPYLLRMTFFLTSVDAGIVHNLAVTSKSQGLVLNDWGCVFSYVLPLALMIIAIFVYSADTYELAYRFFPVFILIAVELIVLNLHLVFGAFFQPSLFTVRIGNFFFRYLYYIPFIYFFSAPLKRFAHDKKRYRIAEAIYNFSNRYIIEKRHIVAAIGIAAISFVILASSVKYCSYYVKFADRRMVTIDEKLSKMHGIVVSNDIAMELLASITPGKHPLMINSFNSYAPLDEVIDRILLFAKLNKWTKKELLDFMTPDAAFDNFYKDNNLVITDRNLKKGFGYWLAWHHRQMTPQEMANYKNDIIRRFQVINLNKEIKKYSIGLGGLNR